MSRCIHGYIYFKSQFTGVAAGSRGYGGLVSIKACDCIFVAGLLNIKGIILIGYRKRFRFRDSGSNIRGLRSDIGYFFTSGSSQNQYKYPYKFYIELTSIILGRSKSTEFMMHLSTSGSFRWHTFMYDAGTEQYVIASSYYMYVARTEETNNLIFVQIFLCFKLN